MSLTIKQRDTKYRLSIDGEEFEFSSKKSLQDEVSRLLDLKEKNGKIKDETRY